MAPWLKQSRMALFLSAAALVPSALLAILLKGAAALAKYSEAGVGIAERPSEAIEFYLYFFMMAYLILLERRIRELETEGSRAKAKAAKT
jgi:hypothetical protein